MIRRTDVKPGVRPVYRRKDIQCVIDPASIALIGASPTPTSLAHQTLLNLSNFAGPLYRVNSRYQKIGDADCYASVSELPTVPECAVLAIGRDLVLPVAEECAARGVKGLVIYAAGFAETGEAERIEQQARLSALARESGMRIVGPNCLGLFNHQKRYAMAFSKGMKFADTGACNIGLISQSGGISNGLTQALHHGVTFSHSLSAGNACDVDMADYVAYLAEEPGCQSIALVFEGLPAPERLIEAAELAAACGKPLVIYKTGRGASGAEAAMSHSGFLAGSHEAYRAAFRRTGAIEAASTVDMLERAAFFAKAAEPKGAGVAVIANSGGAAVISADEAEAYGVALPQPCPATLEVLRRNMADFAVPRNPCDAQAAVMGNPEKFAECVEAFFRDPAYSAVLMPYLYCTDAPDHAARFAILDELAGRHGKVAIVAWMSEWLEGPGSANASKLRNVAVFRDMGRAFGTIAAWQQLARAPAPGRPRTRLSPPGAVKAAAALIRSATNKVLTERESKAVLALYGIPVVEEKLVTNRAEAVAAAESLGTPVALKVESPDLPHKTEAGVIRLNLRNVAEVGEAFDAVMANAAKVTPPPRIHGVLVQPMAPQGVEMMIGGRIDGQFGPLVIAGLGGVLVELLKDTTAALAPLSLDEAAGMLARLKGQAMLDGFRGAPAVARQAFADIIVRTSEFLADQAAEIAELDINPLICSDINADNRGIVAVDALIVRK
jgi:acyl-CoA synthetase (NDP forming)